MPDNQKNEPRIIERGLDEFAEKLIYLIASEPLENLKQIISSAKQEYDNRQGIFTAVVKLCPGVDDKTQGFDEFSKAITTFPHEYNRLSAFLLFVQTGQWKSTSKNTFMMIKLINAVKGYKTELPEYLHEKIIDDLQVNLKLKITQKLKEYDKLNYENHKKNELLRQEVKRELDNLQYIKLLDKPEAWEPNAKGEPLDFSFYLTNHSNNQNKPVFALNWITPAGETNKLLMNDSLKRKLNQWGYDMSLWDDNTLISIKKDLRTCLDDFLGRVKIYIDPSPIRQKDSNNCFFVFTEQREIFWVTGTDKRISLPRPAYNKLYELIIGLESDNEGQLRQIKSHLVDYHHEDTKAKEKFKDTILNLDSQFRKIAGGKKSNNVSPPSKLDLTKFDVIKQCIGNKHGQKKVVSTPGKIDFSAYGKIANQFNGTFFAAKKQQTLPPVPMRRQTGQYN